MEDQELNEKLGIHRILHGVLFSVGEDTVKIIPRDSDIH